MHLTGNKSAELVYVLLNTPEDIAKWEVKHNYDAMEKEYRIKTFSVSYQPEIIDELKNRVTNVREYIKQLTNE